MDLHFATEKVAGLKDAALRYLVIVAGILTALALNQWLEVRAQGRQGAQALSSIEDELRRNQAVLGQVISQQQRALAKLTAIETQLGEDSFAVPDLAARARRVLDDRQFDGATEVQLAALQRSAWDAAVVSQSLQYVAKERAVALARAYAALDGVTGIARQTAYSATTFDNLIALDMFNRKESPDALRFARGVRQHRLVLQGIHAGYLSLQKALAEALGEPVAAPAPAPAPATPPASGGRP